MSRGAVSARVDLGAVLGAGRELELRQAVPLPDFASFSFPNPASVALTARRVGRGVELEGTIDVTAVGPCARCLEDVTLPLHLDVCENLDPGGEQAGPLGENNVLVGDQLDLPDLVRQVIDSALPLVVICKEDCRGISPE